MKSQAITSMPDKNAQTKPLWTCPRCGHRFVSPNMAHSCLQVELATHFAGKDKRIRKLFDAWLAFVRKFGGPVTVNSQKSQITFQARIRFAGATVRKQWVECGFWLKRPVTDTRFHKVEKIPPRNYIYYFKLTDPAQLDERMQQYIKEAYEVGNQKMT